MTDFIDNIFIPKGSMTHNDPITSETIEITQMNVSKYFKYVYIVCKKNNNMIPSDFYNYNISKDMFDDVSKNLLLFKVSVKILKNKNHFDNTILIPSENIATYNIFNYSISDKVIILPILNIEYMNLLKYFEQYESNNTLENIYKMKVLNKYFMLADNTKAIDYICSNIKEMEETNWYTNTYNCMFNFTKNFKERQFSMQTNYIVNKSLAQIIKKINLTQKQKDVDNEHYIHDLLTDNMSNEYNFLKSPQSSDFTRDDINNLFDVLNLKERFILYAYMMISPRYCHLVVNNSTIQKMMLETEKKFTPLFRYIKSYAFIELYKKETNRKTSLKITDESVFSIDAASLLLVYPFNHAKPKEHPYMPIMVDDTLLKPENNFHGIHTHYMDTNMNNMGICTLDEFKSRMNIFTTNNMEHDLFEGYDFILNQACITGGIMSACLQKRHPLLSRFKGNNMTQQYTNYFDEYYCKSDIDVMFKAKDDMEFIKKAYEFHNIIVLNSCRFGGAYVDPSHIKLQLDKLGYLFVTEKFIKENIGGDIEYIKENINDTKVKESFRPYYEKLLVEYVKNISEDIKKEYPDIFRTNNIDFKIYLNKTEKQMENKDINLTFTYKYKITSPHLKHSLELFPIKYDDFFAVISSFHLPCVRACYTGSNVYMTTSCVTAHHTYMNIDYKYFTGTKDPFDIISKYCMRGGWGLWMNEKEKSQLVEYYKNVPFWNNLYSLNPNSTTIIIQELIFSTKSLNHKLFRPRLYSMDDYIDCDYVDTNNRYNNMETTVLLNQHSETLFNSHETKINYDIFQAIDRNGNIIPVKKWIIDFTWEISI